jgi:hypothetical protein
MTTAREAVANNPLSIAIDRAGNQLDAVVNFFWKRQKNRGRLEPAAVYYFSRYFAKEMKAASFAVSHV